MGAATSTAAWPYAQWPLWQRGEIPEFIWAMFGVAGVGMLFHMGWYAFFKKGVLPEERYKRDNSDPRLVDANSFVQMVLSLFFVANWGSLYLGYNPTPFTIGQQSGACAGYEVYGALTEVLRVIGGQFRTDMMLHHGMCMVFTAVTLGVYNATPTADLTAWHIIWDSISRLLVSNLTLNLRYFFITNKLTTYAFAFSFLWVRVVEQVPFMLALPNHLGGITPITGVVVACWYLLQGLDVYWTYLIFKMALRGDKKKTPKSDIASPMAVGHKQD
eukprot:Hpha_TRINITY_DN15117_c1_g2::TRINITY_DN15117_c1_g2_i1::g.129794::m.129794